MRRETKEVIRNFPELEQVGELTRRNYLLNVETGERVGCARWDNSRIGERGRLAIVMAKYAINGQVSYNVDATDCDHCRVEYSDNMPARVMPFWLRMMKEYDDAEGITNVWVDTPVDEPEHSFRDMAMEAREDGHPHVIYR